MLRSNLDIYKNFNTGPSILGSVSQAIVDRRKTQEEKRKSALAEKLTQLKIAQAQAKADAQKAKAATDASIRSQFNEAKQAALDEGRPLNANEQLNLLRTITANTNPTAENVEAFAKAQKPYEKFVAGEEIDRQMSDWYLDNPDATQSEALQAKADIMSAVAPTSENILAGAKISAGVKDKTKSDTINALKVASKNNDQGQYQLQLGRLENLGVDVSQYPTLVGNAKGMIDNLFVSQLGAKEQTDLGIKQAKQDLDVENFEHQKAKDFYKREWEKGTNRRELLNKQKELYGTLSPEARKDYMGTFKIDPDGKESGQFLSDKYVTEINTAYKDRNVFNRDLMDIKKQIESTSDKNRYLPGPEKAKLASSYVNLIMSAKDMYGMKAPQKPELLLLERVLADPTKLWDLDTKKKALATIENYLEINDNRLIEKGKSLGFDVKLRKPSAREQLENKRNSQKNNLIYPENESLIRK